MVNIILLKQSSFVQAGAYIVEIFNTQAGGLSLLFLAFFESLAIGWIYGAERLLDNVETMIGYRPSRWWLFCWKFFSPVIILGMTSVIVQLNIIFSICVLYIKR